MFDKEHRNVLRDIDKIIESIGQADKDSETLDELKFELANFIKITYKDEQNKPRPEYLLTKDGFTFLVMGYEGDEALRFKLAYIYKFSKIESCCHVSADL